MTQPLELPAVFPARVNGQQSMVVVTPDQIKWHPAPTEFTSRRLEGGVIDIVEITAVHVHDLGANGVLQVTSTETVRIHAAGELVDRVRRHIEPPTGR